MSNTAMRHLVVLASLAALGLTACGEDPDATSDDPGTDAATDAADGAEAEGDANADIDEDVEVEEDVDPGDVVGDGLFGLAFEGLWRFDDVTDAALVLESDADPDTVTADLADQDGVVAVERLDDEAVDDRAALDTLLPPDEPTPPVLAVTAEDHGTAAAFDDADDRDEVAFAFAPSCDALAGAARHDGVATAEERLDEADCDGVVVIDAQADAEPTWVAAAGVDGDEHCIATASGDASGSTCQDVDGEQPMRLATQVGGFVIGFAPDDAGSVEIDDGADIWTVDTVAVDEGAVGYAAHLPDPDGDTDVEVVEAPDIGDINVRFLDEDGEVIEEA